MASTAQFDTDIGETQFFNVQKLTESGGAADGDPQEIAISTDVPSVVIGILDGNRSSFWSQPWEILEFFAWFGFLVFLGILGWLLIRQIQRSDKSLLGLISEPGPNGKASLSRFQALVFTFVFMIGVVLIIVRTGQFPHTVPPEMLWILGGSLGTYLVSKGIQGDRPSLAAAGGHPIKGPLLRGSDQDGTKVLASKGEFHTHVPVSVTTERVVVAVVAGETTLAVSVSGPAAGFETLKIKYRKAGATDPVEEELVSNAPIIVGEAKLISEVAVLIKGKVAGGMAEITVKDA